MRARPSRAALALLLGLLPAAAPAQVSPGPLARPHAALEGNLNCLKCHGTKHGRAMDAQCLACHKEIASLVAAKRGLHGQGPLSDCAKCHPDHGGTDFALVKWDAPPEQFDHRRAGWALEGKHARLKCADCHAKPEYRTGTAASVAPGALSMNSWLGLDVRCGACHEDVHKGALGNACTNCHAGETFKVPKFDHTKTTYPLTGKHATVECTKCHMAASLTLPVDREGKPKPLYKPLPHAECSACHKDPHAGRLGAACSKCHVTTGFKEVPRESFDHSRTRYPLTGAHRRARCETCHDPRPGAHVERPAFDRCTACHADAHRGLATLAGQPADCGACHTTESYAPSTYTIEKHASTSYPLLGKHRDVTCRKCHVKLAENAPDAAGQGPARIVMRPRHERCTSCHADAHAGQLARRADRGACEGCHRVDGFKPAVYSVKDHAALAFALEGKHASTECALCHRPAKGRSVTAAEKARWGAAAFDMRPATDCAVCHTDPHKGRFAPDGPRPAKNGCLACHTATAWSPSKIDGPAHAAFGLALDGAHLAVPCLACHKELAAPAPAAGRPPRTLLFQDDRRRCEACHENPHGTQFAARPGGAGCEACHDAASFKPARRFDHDRDSAFRLAGAHAHVPCARCHVAQPAATGRTRTLYRPTPKKCADCHTGPRR